MSELERFGDIQSDERENLQENQFEVAEIPEEIRAVIEQQVDEVMGGYETNPADADDIVAGLDIEDDADGVADQRDMLLDAELSTYSFLRWINDEKNPDRVFYPGSGSNKVPKLAFGEDKVVHTSLEEHDPKEPGVNYFNNLGEGMKVVADNNFLPFKDKSFQAVCLLDSPSSVLGVELSEYGRVLTDGGRILLSSNMFLDDEPGRMIAFETNPDFEQEEVHEAFQQQGDSASEFFVFRKKSDK